MITIVQCEDLYEPISCLLPEVAASPAPHCTYLIFGKNIACRAPVRFLAATSFFLLFFLFFSNCRTPYFYGHLCAAYMQTSRFTFKEKG